MTITDEDTRLVIGLERRLLDPEVRRQRDQVAALLHPEFIEFGASGRIWTKSAIVESLANEFIDAPDRVIRAVNIRATALSADLIHVTYETRVRSGGTRSLRSSVWVRDETGAWVVRFHQGTLVPGSAAGPASQAGEDTAAAQSA